MSLPPGPSQTALRQTWRWVSDPIGFLDEMAGRYGYGTPFTMRRVGGMELVVVSDPEHVKEVFQDTETYLAGKSQEAVKRFVGPYTLFALDGEDHKRHRRLLMPPFVGERMKAYGELMCALARREIARWELGESFTLVPCMTRVTLSVIFHAVFGVTDPTLEARLTELLIKLTGGGRALLAYMPFLQVDLGGWSPYGRFRKTQAEFDSIIFDAIRQAREAPEGREDILARLIVEGTKQGDSLSDLEIRDELVTLLAAGHETTASAMCWSLQWILGIPRVKERLFGELKEVVGEGPFSPEHLRRLPYLSAAADEALRLHPPIPNCGRWVAKQTTLAGYDLPVGSYVTPCPYLTHRTPSLYPQPDVYRPERFLGAKRSPWEFFPFGGGKRTCIGFAFAKYEMQILLATILTETSLRLVDSPSHASKRRAILILPKNEVPVVLERRQVHA